MHRKEDRSKIQKIDHDASTHAVEAMVPTDEDIFGPEVSALIDAEIANAQRLIIPAETDAYPKPLRGVKRSRSNSSIEEQPLGQAIPPISSSPFVMVPVTDSPNIGLKKIIGYKLPPLPLSDEEIAFAQQFQAEQAYAQMIQMQQQAYYQQVAWAQYYAYPQMQMFQAPWLANQTPAQLPLPSIQATLNPRFFPVAPTANPAPVTEEKIWIFTDESHKKTFS